MQKEILQKENICRDLILVAKEKMSIASDYYLLWIVPYTGAALFVGFLTRKIWIGLLIFSLAVYPIAKYIQAIFRHGKLKKEIVRQSIDGKLNVSVEQLDRIQNEIVYEPRMGYRRTVYVKEVRTFRFSSGLCWRVPDSGIFYRWSKTYHLSRSGLENTSVPGDEFYFVALPSDNDISYIYPCKYFIYQGAERAT